MSKPAHSTYARYQAGCRQPCCVQAERAYQNMRNRRIAYGQPLKVPSIGSVRRIQALMADGWTGQHLARELGIRRNNLPVYCRFPTIRAWKAQQIAELYDQMKGQSGPSERTAARAAAAGFLPPESWEHADIDNPDALPVIDYHDPAGPDDVDEVAVQRAAQGDRTVKLTPPERREAIRLLHSQGLSDNAIADRIGAVGRTVHRIRQKLDLPAVDLEQRITVGGAA